ncbi:hypothetical protein [Acinetobacter sp. ANC 3882]|uniref:hypothetical protein n=1 Tax=Acinetobacter sp. ANC 3882 TaxID=2923423 RepID=UPI001F4B6261|nr:hypothetical protein [Acinetobacter sp. ANC 3882]MCH7312912.1 hypothetical protein [Acinetobacter sp. ANC 3882]
MVQPYDYTLNVQNPSEVFTNSLWNGYKLGATMDQVKQQREQAALKQQQEQQRAEDTRSLIQNQTNENFTSFQLMYPDQAETIQKVWQQKSQGDKDFSWRVGSEALAALKSDSPDIAEQVFQKAAVHYDNSGRKQDAGSMRFYADLIKKNPANAKSLMQDYLSTVDRERFDKTFVPLNEQNRANEMQPYEIAKKEAETAKINAETNDIPLAAADRNQGVINQARGTELDNQYKYDQLAQLDRQFYDGLDKSERIEADRLRARKAETATQRMERLEKAEGLAVASKNAADASVNAARLANITAENGGAYWDRLWRIVPGSTENSYAKDIETLKSQVFLAQVDKMRGLGALTEREGDALKSSIASLDINQGPKRVQENLTQIARIMSEAAKSASRKTKIYATRGQGYAPDVVDAARALGITPEEAQKFVNDNGL